MEIRQLSSGNWAIVMTQSIDGKEYLWDLCETRDEAEAYLVKFFSAIESMKSSDRTSQETA